MQTILKPKNILFILLIASFYITFVTYLMNTSLVLFTVTGGYPLEYKFKLLLSLLQGMWTAMSGIGLLTLFITAILTGANLTLLFQRIVYLKSAGNLKLIVGGSSILGLVSSGCAACGLPILALLGLSGSIAYLPLRGIELSYISIFLLLGSFYLLVKSSDQMRSCKL